MLENQFFPTPDAVADRMMAGLAQACPTYTKVARDYKSKILDPQAGNGALLSRFRKRYSRDLKSSNFHAVEIDYQLREVLKAEDFCVIGTDWLAYQEPIIFDVILSNPPFADGARHALKSLEHLAPGGVMACLLNAETLRNAHTSDRRMLLSKLATLWGIDPDDHGITSQLRLASADGEFDQSGYSLLAALESAGAIEWFGQCFKDAERPTSVEIVCLYISNPKQAAKSTDWGQGTYTQGEDVSNPEFRANPLAHRSAIRTIVTKYQQTTALLEQRAKIDAEMKWWLTEIETYNYSGKRSNDLFLDGTFIEQHRQLKSLFWATVFKKTDLGSRIGSTEQRNFQNFAIQQQNLEFTEDNIVEMLQVLIGDIDGIMHRMVVEVWDKLVGYHKDNKAHSEGWVTNSPAKIKKDKLIFPWGVSYHPDLFGFRVYRSDFWVDLDKSLCWISGIDYKANAEAGIACQLEKACRSANSGNKHNALWDSMFFEFRIFKKGTVHLFFKDGQLAKDFSIAAAKGRNWIGEQDN